ncbi:MAG: cupin domain-containing protein [Chromatiales bacterium]|nr:cupin domain-containing protein [Gammaproteobacteria bacterium]MCP5352863.1 cupin domain-containing protein [Chromatiales bacterium]
MQDTIITVEHNPSPAKLDVLWVEEWPIWQKEESEFPWTYDEKEMCYLLAGEAIVTPDGGEPVTIKAKDLVTFPKGMSCTWQITKAVRKHYRFGD